MSSKYEELIKYVKQTEALSHASGLIAWDQETKMPKGSVEQRADTLSVLESEIHKRKSNKYVEELISNIKKDELTKNDKDLVSYIKTAKGYVEVPISLIDKDNSASYYLLSTISQHIGQNGLQYSDLHKIFSVIAENNRNSFYENWEISTQSGLLIFINKEKWLAREDFLEPLGYFNLKKYDSINILNNWSISLPNYLEKEIYFTVVSDGDLFKVGSHTQKATELFRSYGVSKLLREVWPVLKLKDTILWIPGIRKSNEGNWLETQKDKFIISASKEKSNIENF